VAETGFTRTEKIVLALAVVLAGLSGYVVGCFLFGLAV
jgi:hypothetical protein